MSLAAASSGLLSSPKSMASTHTRDESVRVREKRYWPVPGSKAGKDDGSVPSRARPALSTTCSSRLPIPGTSRR
jgi:hypothetical protein